MWAQPAYSSPNEVDPVLRVIPWSNIHHSHSVSIYSGYILTGLFLYVWGAEEYPIHLENKYQILFLVLQCLVYKETRILLRRKYEGLLKDKLVFFTPVRHQLWQIHISGVSANKQIWLLQWDALCASYFLLCWILSSFGVLGASFCRDGRIKDREEQRIQVRLKLLLCLMFLVVESQLWRLQGLVQRKEYWEWLMAHSALHASNLSAAPAKCMHLILVCNVVSMSWDIYHFLLLQDRARMPPPETLPSRDSATSRSAHRSRSPPHPSSRPRHGPMDPSSR